MRLFFTAAALLFLALLATSPALYRLRRSRLGSAAMSGGWIALLAGILLGPVGVGLIPESAVFSLTPLLAIGLGWIGLMVGLQARRAILQRIPREVWRVVIVDTISSAVIFGSVAFLLVRIWRVLDDSTPLPLTTAIVLLAATSVGWSMETRSLRLSDSTASQRVAFLLRASGGLGAIAAVAIFGVGSELAVLDAGAAGTGRVIAGGLGLLIIVAIALGVGWVGREALRLANRDRAALLVVFLGVVALAAGLAFDLGHSPLFAAMLTGVVIANLSGDDPAIFGRFILAAEHIVAVLFSILAGVLIDPAIGAAGLLLAAALAVVRLIAKPIIFRLGARGAIPTKDESDAGAAALLSPARQSTIAIAMAVSLILSVPTEPSRELLTIVVVGGLLSDIFAVTATRLLGGPRLPDESPRRQPNDEGAPQ